MTRDAATRQSGDPKAWSYLAAWIAFHHTTLINATLACILLKRSVIPDVAATHFLQLSLLYRADRPDLPPERRFELRGAHFLHKDEPGIAPGKTYGDLVWVDRAAAERMGRMSMEDAYWGTGAYLLMVRFGKDVPESVPFWKHFGIDDLRARAIPACGHPFERLKYNLHEGVKPRFCCGRIPGLPTCCCGGWTHDKVR